MSDQFPQLRRVAYKYAECYTHIENLSLEDLEAMLTECDAVSQTNCWFAVYESAKAFRADIEGAIYRRKKLMESAEL